MQQQITFVSLFVKTGQALAGICLARLQQVRKDRKITKERQAALTALRMRAKHLQAFVDANLDGTSLFGRSSNVLNMMTSNRIQSDINVTKPTLDHFLKLCSSIASLAHLIGIIAAIRLLHCIQDISRDVAD